MPTPLRIEIYQYRLLPTVRFSLSSDGRPVDLTGKTVRFVLGRKDTGYVQFRRDCLVVGASMEGRCEFRWSDGDTDQPEEGLDGELEWELSDGRTQTLAVFKVSIRPSLGQG